MQGNYVETSSGGKWVAALIVIGMMAATIYVLTLAIGPEVTAPHLPAPAPSATPSTAPSNQPK
jgi:hypothetical protein